MRVRVGARASKYVLALQSTCKMRARTPGSRPGDVVAGAKTGARIGGAGGKALWSKISKLQTSRALLVSTYLREKFRKRFTVIALSLRCCVAYSSRADSKSLGLRRGFLLTQLAQS